MTDVGEATFRALANFGGIRREAKATGRDIKNLKRDLQSLDTDVTFEADTSRIRPGLAKGVKAAVVQVEAKDATVEFEADTSKMEAQIRKAVAGDRDSKGRFIKVGTVLDDDLARQVDAAAAKAGQGAKVNVPIEPDSTGLRARIRAGIAKAQRGLEVNVPLKVKDGKAAFAAIGGSIDLGAIGSGVVSLLKIPAALAAIKAAGPVFASLSAGAVGLVAALAPLLGVLGAIPVFAITAAAGLGTLFAGFSGIGTALKAVSAEDKTSASTAASTAKAVEAAGKRREAAARGVLHAQQALASAQENAADQLVASQRAVVDAEENLASAQERSRRAQEALTRSREDAIEALQQLRFANERNSISEERAQLRLEDARSRLTDVQSDPFASARDQRDAILEVADAELSLREIQDQRADDVKKLSDAEAKGVDGSDEVVASLRDQEDADKDVIRAQRDLVDSQQALTRTQRDGALSVARAQEDLTLALEESADAARDFGDAGVQAGGAVAAALDNLSPAGRRFVNFLLSLKPALDDIRGVAQAGLLPGVEDGIRRAMRLLPVIRQMVADTATTFGDLARRAGEFAGSPFFSDALRQLSGTGTKILTDTGDATLLFADALTRVAVAAQPLAIFLGHLLERAGQAFDTWVRGAEASGEMTRFFGQTADVVDGLVDILGSLFSLIGSVLQAAKPLGDDIFGGLADGLERAAEWADSFKGQTALRDFFESARPILRETWGLLGDIVKLFGSLFSTESPEAAGLIAQIRRDIIPALAAIFESTGKIAGPLIDLARAFLEFFGVFATESGPLIGFVETLTRILDTLTALMDENPRLKTFIFTLLLLGGGLKAFASIGSLFSGLIPLFGLIGPWGVLLLALGAAFAFAYLKSETFREAVQGALEWLQENVLPTLTDFVDSVRESFSDAADWVSLHMADIEEAVGHVLSVVKFLWDHFGEDLVNRAEIMWQKIAEVVNAGLDIIRGIIEFVLAIINGDWGKAWDALLTILRGIWDLAFGVVRGALDTLLNTISLGLDAIRAVWDVIWGGISAGFGAIWEGITDTIRGGVQALINILNGMIDGVNTILGVLPGNLKIPGIPDLKAESSGAGKRADSSYAGGSYHRNQGGSIPGRGPDRDTVHAMLTPGEFVVRRRAVDAFGVDRLEQINRMGYNQGGPVGSRGNPVRRALGGLIPNPIPDIIDLGGKIVSGAAGLVEDVARRGASAVWAGVRKVAETGINALPIGNSTIAKMIKGAPLRALDAIGNLIKGKDTGPANTTAKGIDPAFLQAFRDYSGKYGPLAITSGFRTAAQQAALYKAKPGLAAPPGQSNHERGKAIDHSPHSTPSMRRGAVDFGLWYPMASLTANTAARPGGKYEPWHVEPIATKKNLGGMVTVPHFDLGGIVEHDGLARVHRKEMVLPERISTAVQDMAEGRGGDVNVTVINPVPETASTSVNRTVRKLSYLGDL